MNGPGEDANRPPATEDSRVEVRHDGHVVAAADIKSSPEPHGTATVSLRAHHDQAPPEARGELVDQVLDQPGVSNSDKVHVVLPLGDSASISRLRERTTNVNARAAGASSVIEAEVPQPDEG